MEQEQQHIIVNSSNKKQFQFYLINNLLLRIVNVIFDTLYTRYCKIKSIDQTEKNQN